MTIRTVFVGAAALIFSATFANAQAPASKQVVISKAVLKTMVANKPKAKTPLGAKAGIRRSKVVTGTPANAGPTSVREIKPISKRN
jgi:hypothetical protein